MGSVEEGNKITTKRGLIKFILLSIVTLGIYQIVFYSKISTNINLIAKDGKNTMHYCLIFFVFSWMTLGIVPLVWMTRVSSRIGRELDRRNLGYSFGAGSFWGWNILGTIIIVGPFIYIHKLCKSMNLLCEDYNNKG